MIKDCNLQVVLLLSFFMGHFVCMTNMYENFSYSFDEDFKVSANRFFIVKIYTPCFVLGVSSELQHNN